MKSAKRCLNKQLGNVRLMTCGEFSKVLIEVQAVLNSRPLTYVYAEDIENPLTLSHLLTGKRLLTLPDTQQCGKVPSSTQEAITKEHDIDVFWLIISGEDRKRNTC